MQLSSHGKEGPWQGCSWISHTALFTASWSQDTQLHHVRAGLQHTGHWIPVVAREEAAGYLNPARTMRFIPCSFTSKRCPKIYCGPKVTLEYKAINGWWKCLERSLEWMPPNSWDSLVLEFSLCPQSHCTSFIGSDNCYGFLIPSCRQYKKGFLVSGQYFDHCQKQWRNLCSSLNDEKLVILGDNLR